LLPPSLSSDCSLRFGREEIRGEGRGEIGVLGSMTSSPTSAKVKSPGKEKE